MSRITRKPVGGGASKAEVEAVEEEIDNIESGTTLVSLIEKAIANPEPKTITSGQNNWAIGPVAYIEVTSSALRAINGIVAPAANRPGLVILRLNGATSFLEIHHENASAEEHNRFALSLAGTEKLRLGYPAIFVYDHIKERWVDLTALSAARTVQLTIPSTTTEITLAHNLNTIAIGINYVIIPEAGVEEYVGRSEVPKLTKVVKVNSNEVKFTFSEATTSGITVIVVG